MELATSHFSPSSALVNAGMGFSAASTGLGPLGRFARRLIDGPLGLLARSVSLEHNVIDLLEKRAIEQSVEYISAHMGRALAMRSREDLWTYAGSRATAPGLWLEFGVFSGYSINFLAKLAGRTVVGFDSFEGLQEVWQGPGLPKGSFDRRGKLPKVRKNVRLVKGWFYDTLPSFLATEQQLVSLLHLDCDTYEATAYVLHEVADRLTPATVIILDDYHGHRGFKDGQFKAWAEFVEEHRLSYRYAAFNRHAVAICDVQPIKPTVSNQCSAAQLQTVQYSGLTPAQ